MKVRAAIAGLLAVVALVTNGEVSAATGRISVDVAGQKRDVLLIETARLKRTPRTTIIILRGGGSQARTVATDRRGIGLAPIVRSDGVVIAYPDALNATWNLGTGGPDDAGFVRTLATKLIADGIADRRRIFLVGGSTGGMLALKIACEGADYLAGVAIMIAAMPGDMAANCKIAKPMAFMIMNGTADPLMPYQGGVASLNAYKGIVVSAEDTLKPFREAAQCGAERTKLDIPDRDPNDGSRIVLERLSGCKAIIELVRVDGGGHTLPGRPARADRGLGVGAMNNDVSTPRVLWDFVRRALR